LQHRAKHGAVDPARQPCGLLILGTLIFPAEEKPVTVAVQPAE
jgi:hypothetical protein